MSSNHSQGPWRAGKESGSIVCDDELLGPQDGTREAYGGGVVAETVSPRNRPIIMAAPHYYNAVDRLVKAGKDHEECKRAFGDIVIAHLAAGGDPPSHD